MDDAAAFVAPPAAPPSFLTNGQLRQLCTDGYLTISLPDALKHDTDAFFSASKDFFDLPTASKASLYPPVTGALEHGYYHIESEKEFLTFRYRSIDQDPPLVEQMVSHVWHDLSHLLYRILADVGDVLYIHHEAWRPLVEQCLTLPTSKTAMPSLLRSFRYQPLSGVADPHNDLGLLTICICRGAGLQVWERPVEADAKQPDGGSREPSTTTSTAGQWIDAGEVTLLVGDTLRVLSSNRVRAGKHRVVANPEGRSSIVFALRPSTSGMIDLRMFGGYGEIEAKALWDRMKSNRVNVNAQKDVREEQRQRRAEHKRT